MEDLLLYPYVLLLPLVLWAIKKAEYLLEGLLPCYRRNHIVSTLTIVFMALDSIQACLVITAR